MEGHGLKKMMWKGLSMVEKPIRGQECLLWPSPSQGERNSASKLRRSWWEERLLIPSFVCENCGQAQACQVCCCRLLSPGTSPGGCLFSFQLQESPGLYRAAGLTLWKNVTFLLLDLCVHLYCLICVLYSFCLLHFPELKQSVFFHICTFGFIPFMPEKCLRMFLVDTLAIFTFQNFFFHLQSQYFIAQSLLFFFF